MLNSFFLFFTSRNPVQRVENFLKIFFFVKWKIKIVNETYKVLVPKST